MAPCRSPVAATLTVFGPGTFVPDEAVVAAAAAGVTTGAVGVHSERGPPGCGAPFNCIAGSPKKIHDLRRSGLVTTRLAAAIASPTVAYVPWKIDRKSTRLTRDWVDGGVALEDAHTATAPPCGARCSDSARLSSSQIWLKRPLRQFIATTNGRRDALRSELVTS